MDDVGEVDMSLYFILIKIRYKVKDFFFLFGDEGFKNDWLRYYSDWNLFVKE